MTDLKRIEYLRGLHGKLEMGDQKRISQVCGCTVSYVYEVLVYGRNETKLTRRIIRAAEIIVAQRAELQEQVLQVA